jgi:hypothetical protein
MGGSWLGMHPGLGVRRRWNLQPTEDVGEEDNGLGETPAILFRFYKLFRSCSSADPIGSGQTMYLRTIEDLEIFVVPYAYQSVNLITIL